MNTDMDESQLPPDDHQSTLIPNDWIIGHYTSIESMLTVLSAGTFKFSPLNEMNDPWENQPREFFRFARDEGNKDNTLPVENNLKFDLHNHVKLFCATHSLSPPKVATQLHPEVPWLTSDQHVDLCVNDDVGQMEMGACHACFERLRMWEQYGDRRRGACLLIDRVRLRKQIEENYKRNVSGFVAYAGYPDSMSIRNQATAIQSDRSTTNINKIVDFNLNCNCSGLFFLKDIDWASENEFRFAILDRNKGSTFVKFGDSLRAIVLGWECHPALRHSIAKLVDVPVYQLVWNKLASRLQIPMEQIPDLEVRR